jgi:hypothetical protein
MLSVAPAQAADLYNPVLSPIAGPECGDASRILAITNDYTNYPWDHFAILTGPNTPFTYQLNCTTGSFSVNTTTTGGGNYGVNLRIPSSVLPLAPFEASVLGDGPGGFHQMGRFTAGASEIRPWASTTGDPDLVIEFKAMVPTLDRGTAPNVQFNIDFYVFDVTTKQFFAYIINVAIAPASAVPNPGYGEAKLRDDQTAEDGFPFIATSLQSDGTSYLAAQFFTRSPYSRGHSTSPWTDWRFFRVHISREQIERAAVAINALGPRHLFSTNASDYLLTSAGLLQEQSGPSFVASSFQDFALYIATTQPVGLTTPVPIAPSGPVTLPTTFSWYYVPGALTYELYVVNLNGASFDLSYNPYTVGCGPSTICTTPAVHLDPGQTYSWLVRAMNYNTVTAWSDPINISTPGGGPTANWALASNGATAVASSTYSGAFPASAAIDGSHSGQNYGAGGAWNDATAGTWGDWLEVDLAQPRTLNRVVVYTLADDYYTGAEPTDTTTFTQYGITDYTVELYNGTSWVEVGSVTGNDLVKRTFDFPPTTAHAVRVLIWDGHTYSVITELEAFGS